MTPGTKREERHRADARTLATFRQHIELLRNVRIKGGTHRQAMQRNSNLRKLRDANVKHLHWVEELTTSVFDRGPEAPEWADNPAQLPEIERGEVTRDDIVWIDRTVHGVKERRINPDDVKHLAKLAAKVQGEDSSVARLIESEYSRVADYWSKQTAKANKATAAKYPAPDLADIEDAYAEIVADLSLNSPEMQQELRLKDLDNIDRRRGAIRRFAASEFRELIATTEPETFDPPAQPERASIVGAAPETDAVAEMNRKAAQRTRAKLAAQRNPTENLGTRR